MKATLRRAAATLGLTSVAVGIALGLAEIVVRLLFAGQIVLFPRYHTAYEYGPYTLRGSRPDTRFRHTSPDGSWLFSTNSRGLRDVRDFPYLKRPGSLRVLAIGDSHTQGYEVAQDETFAAVIERFLRHRGVDAEVLNAGVSGFSNAEELAYLEHEGLRYQPDVVVLGFFANDFEDNLKAGLFSLDAEGGLVEERHEHIPGVRVLDVVNSVPPMRWLSENSYFYSLLFNGVWNYFKALLAESTAAAAADGAPPSAASAFENAVPGNMPLTAYQLALAVSLLERMQQLCAAKGIRFIVVDIPISPARYATGPSLPPSLVEHLRTSGIEYVSSEDTLGAYNGAVDMHWRQGLAHINPLAHAMIGNHVGGLIIGDRTRSIQ